MTPARRDQRCMRPRAGRPLTRLIPAATAVSMAIAAVPVRAQEVLVCTDRGRFTIELSAQAPAHTANFLRLIEEGFYNGTVFHRVVADRIIQGGGYDRSFARRPTGDPVVNESQNGLKNVRGTVAAARLRDPDSASAQFFINLAASNELDATNRRPGYTVFGRVTSGMDVVDEIGNLPTGPAGPLPQEVPDPLVVIDAITVISAPPAEPPVVADTATAPVILGDEPARRPPAFAVVDALRADCLPVAEPELIAEAEAALEAGLTRRARFALDNFFAIAQPDNPAISRAQGLFRALPRAEQAGIAPLVAQCPTAMMPRLPDGGTATLAEMQTAQTSVLEFIEITEAYLECLSDVIDGESLDDLQEVAAVGAHNEAVARMERTAEDFNRELRTFRERD